MTVKMIWDGGPSVVVPEEMGTPRDDQLQGSTGEKVSELACRVCYDSLGAERSRGTVDNLAHILDVKHLSTLEHYQETCAMFVSKRDVYKAMVVLGQRPGVFFLHQPGPAPGGRLRITANARAIIEWDAWTDRIASNEWFFSYPREHAKAMGALLKQEWAKLCPLLITDAPEGEIESEMTHLGLGSCYRVEPMHPYERWVTLYMVGSRGFSHELVRHGDFTAISQRSTRYVDESGSSYDLHPLIHAYLNDAEVSEQERMILRSTVINGVRDDGEIYTSIVEALQPWLMARMPRSKWRKHTARKQARGAARGMLGNALRTEVIFSAAVGQWRHMMNMRAADAADAEIRIIFAEALGLLKKSRYAMNFADLSLTAASDGLGMSLVSGGAL